jgi:hypothetical protein
VFGMSLTLWATGGPIGGMRPQVERIDEQGLADLVTSDCMVGVAVSWVTEGVAA